MMWILGQRFVQVCFILYFLSGCTVTNNPATHLSIDTYPKVSQILEHHTIQEGKASSEIIVFETLDTIDTVMNWYDMQLPKDWNRRGLHTDAFLATHSDGCFTHSFSIRKQSENPTVIRIQSAQSYSNCE